MKEGFVKYIDGFLLVVPAKNMAEYTKMAETGARVWKKHGALEYVESVGDDLENNMGAARFTDTVKAKPDEKIIFSYIVFKSKAHRDEVNAKVMADPEMGPESATGKPMPFDMKRMAYGGFKAIVEA
jgi:uncharacterized protein YbaA (DUF1428 family)